MKTFKTKRYLSYAILTMVGLLSLGIYQNHHGPTLGVLGTPSNKTFTFDKNSVPTGVHGIEGGIVTLSSSAEGRSDIEYTPAAIYGGYHPVGLGGNYMMSLLPNTGASKDRILEFIFGINNLTSLSITIGHNLANPNLALEMVIFAYEGYDPDDMLTPTGEFMYITSGERAPGTYHFDIVEEHTVGCVQIMFMSGENIVDTDAGETLFIESVTINWYC